MHQQLDDARKQIVAGDYAGAQDTLKKLDNGDLTQPLQNWVTLNQGLISLLQENASDAGIGSRWSRKGAIFRVTRLTASLLISSQA